MNFLNLGCGNRFLTDWVNVDFGKTGEHVIAHNLLNGVPFPDQHFDVVYHSHVLEHFPRGKAQYLIDECYRVLKPGGILRMAVPDLEIIAKEYLRNLERAIHGEANSSQDYEWSMMELFDQMVRHESGGEIGKLWMSEQIPNHEYITERAGDEFISYRKRFLASGNKGKKTEMIPLFSRIKTKLSNKLLQLLTGYNDANTYLRIGKFRMCGENHNWMYDRYSISEMVKKAGFSQNQQMTATTSMILNWQKYNWLDLEDGHIRKPDSLFMEAIK